MTNLRQAMQPEPTAGGPFDRLVVSNFVKLGAGEMISRLLGFVGTIWIARQLGVEGYGVIGLAFAILLYFGAVGDLGMEHLGPREVANDEAPLEDLASSMTFGRLAASAIIAILMTVIGLLFLTRPEGPVLALYGLSLIAMGASTRWVHIGLGNTGTVALSRFLVEGTRVAMLLAFVHSPADLFIVPIIQFVAEAAAAVLLLVALRRRGVRVRARVDTALMFVVLRRGFPLLLTNLLSLVVYNADIVILRVFRDRAEVGLYLSAYTLINFLGVLGNTATLSILPSLSRLRTAADRGIDLVHRGQVQMIAVGLPLAVGGAFLSTPIMDFVFGAEYIPATTALRVLLISIPILFLRSVLQAVLIAAGRQDRVLQVTAWSAGVTILFNLALVPVLGMLGAAITTVLAELARLALAQRYTSMEGYSAIRAARFWQPVVAALMMAGGLYVFRAWAWWLLIPAGGTLYASILLMTGGGRLFTGGRAIAGKS